MRDAGPAEHLPLRFGNRALFADRERDDHAGVRRVGERSKDALAHRRARPLHVIGGTAGKRREPRVRVIGAHVTRCTQAVLEQPGFDVEAVRIDGAMRALQANDKPPALAGRNPGHRVDRAALLPLRVPRERELSRHDGAGRLDTLDGEHETRAARRSLRQVVDHADERDVLALPHRRQLIGKPHSCAPRGIAEAERTRGDERENGCGDAPEQHAPAQCTHAGCSDRGDECAAEPGRDGRQHRLPLQQDDAGGERHQSERQCGHADLRSRALVVDARSGTSRRPKTRSTTRCSDSRRTRAGAPST